MTAEYVLLLRYPSALEKIYALRWFRSYTVTTIDHEECVLLFMAHSDNQVPKAVIQYSRISCYGDQG